MLRIKHGRTVHEVNSEHLTTVGDLKGVLETISGVRASRQKLLAPGVKLDSSTPLATLPPKANLVLVGSVENDLRGVDLGCLDCVCSAVLLGDVPLPQACFEVFGYRICAVCANDCLRHSHNVEPSTNPKPTVFLCECRSLLGRRCQSQDNKTRPRDRMHHDALIASLGNPDRVADQFKRWHATSSPSPLQRSETLVAELVGQHFALLAQGRELEACEGARNMCEVALIHGRAWEYAVALLHASRTAASAPISAQYALPLAIASRRMFATAKAKGHQPECQEAVEAETLPSAEHTAELLRLHGHPTIALKMLLQVLRARRAGRPGRSTALGTASVLNKLATLYSSLGRHRSAAAAMRGALLCHAASCGDSDTGYADLLNNFAVVLQASRTPSEIAEAEAVFCLCLDVRRRWLGPAHPACAAVLHNLAAIYRLQGDHRRAVRTLSEAATQLANLFGKSHPQAAAASGAYALLLSEVGQTVTSVQVLQQTLEARQSVGGGTGPSAQSVDGEILALIARGRLDMGDSEGAMSALEDCLTVRLRVLGPRHPDTVSAGHNLGLLRLAANDPHGAWPLLESALESEEATLGATHPATLSALLHTVRCLFAIGRGCEAADRLIAFWTRQSGCPPPGPDCAMATSALEEARDLLLSLALALPPLPDDVNDYENNLRIRLARLAFSIAVRSKASAASSAPSVGGGVGDVVSEDTGSVPPAADTTWALPPLGPQSPSSAEGVWLSPSPRNHATEENQPSSGGLGCEREDSIRPAPGAASTPRGSWARRGRRGRWWLPTQPLPTVVEEDESSADSPRGDNADCEARDGSKARPTSSFALAWGTEGLADHDHEDDEWWLQLCQEEQLDAHVDPDDDYSAEVEHLDDAVLEAVSTDPTMMMTPSSALPPILDMAMRSPPPPPPSGSTASSFADEGEADAATAALSDGGCLLEYVEFVDLREVEDSSPSEITCNCFCDTSASVSPSVCRCPCHCDLPPNVAFPVGVRCYLVFVLAPGLQAPVLVGLGPSYAIDAGVFTLRAALHFDASNAVSPYPDPAEVPDGQGWLEAGRRLRELLVDPAMPYLPSSTSTHQRQLVVAPDGALRGLPFGILPVSPAQPSQELEEANSPQRGWQIIDEWSVHHVTTALDLPTPPPCLPPRSPALPSVAAAASASAPPLISLPASALPPLPPCSQRVSVSAAMSPNLVPMPSMAGGCRGEALHTLSLPVDAGGASGGMVLTCLWGVKQDTAQLFLRAFTRRLAAAETPQQALRGAQCELRQQDPHPKTWGGFVLHSSPHSSPHTSPGSSPALGPMTTPSGAFAHSPPTPPPAPLGSPMSSPPPSFRRCC
mmetsp:Transcript_25000/g.57588  ORF Transcript_25000/g.57588 Transcript_25000/m.57588 type:complete len:1334 (+) Transcript_25000:184-4185(+)